MSLERVIRTILANALCCPHGETGRGRKTKSRLYKIIEDTPGITFTGLLEATGLGNGGLAYNLEKLEKSRRIKTMRYGKYRRFYPAGYTGEVDTSTQEKIVEYLKDESPRRPSQIKIAADLELSRQTVNYAVAQLQKGGRVRLVKKGRKKEVHLNTGPVELGRI